MAEGEMKLYRSNDLHEDDGRCGEIACAKVYVAADVDELLKRLRWSLVEVKKEVTAITPDWHRAFRIIDEALRLEDAGAKALEHARERLPQLGLHGVLQSDWGRFNAILSAHVDESMERAWRGEADRVDGHDSDASVMIRMINQLATALYREKK